MTSRLLPRDEWPRLAGTLLETVWPSLPRDADVLVVEDDAAIVGCCVLMRVPHLEGAWIAPEHRGKAAVGRRLLSATRALLAAKRVPEVLLMTTRDRNARIAGSLGRVTELAARHFVVETGN